MGIQGLTTFVDAHSHLLTDFELHDTKVVIDGNNLFHFLYYHFSIGPMFGGDYDVYAKGIRFYFNRLRECNIEPYVVFDGAYHPDDRKLKTSLKRANDKLCAARRLAKGEVASVLPLLARETFHCVLTELNVKHFTCQFEADNWLTALANELQCPVMSNDSDFYIYDIHNGFILFDYIHLEKHSKVGEPGNLIHFLKVQIYYLDTFLNNFSGITREEMPLFASLLGNDFISRDDLQPFYASTKISKQSPKKSTVPKRFGIFTSLLTWLESEETVSGAVEAVLQCFKSDKRECVQKQLEVSMNEYRSHSNNPLKFDCHNIVQGAHPVFDLGKSGTIGGKVLPAWVLAYAQHGLLSVSCLNVVVSNRIILPPQVEDLKSCSSHQCSRQLRQIIYTLLLTSVQENVSSVVTEYDKGDGSIKKTEQSILRVGDEPLSDTTLKTIPQVSNIERSQKLLQFLSIPEPLYLRLKGIVGEEGILPYLAVIYWVENASPSVSDIHFKSLVLCFLKIEVNMEQKLGKPEAEQGQCGTDQMSGCQVEKTMEKLEQFCERQKISVYNSSITHAFAQYQSCLQAAVCLNQLLMFPFRNPNPACFINGTFLYNMSRNLLNRKCPDLYIQEILGRGSKLSAKFQSMVQCVIESLSSKDKLLSNIGKGNQKKSKRGKCSAGKKTKDHQLEMDTPSDEENDETESPNHVQILCSTDNKFSLLSL